MAVTCHSPSGEHVALEARQRRRSRARSEVGPHDATAFASRVGGGFTLFLKSDSAGSLGISDARAVDGEFPAVVDAPQAAFFVATKEQGRAPMRAVVLDQADLPAGVAKCDELLAEDQDAERVLNLAREPLRTAGRGPSIRASGCPSACRDRRGTVLRSLLGSASFLLFTLTTAAPVRIRSESDRRLVRANL